MASVTVMVEDAGGRFHRAAGASDTLVDGNGNPLSVGSGISDGDYGDIVVSGGGTVMTIDTVVFTTPLVVHPGEFLSIGLRTLWVNAAVTSGTIDGGLYVNGYWD